MGNQPRQPRARKIQEGTAHRSRRGLTLIPWAPGQGAGCGVRLGKGENCPSQAPDGNFPSPGGRSDPCQCGLSLWGDISGAPRKLGGLPGDSWGLRGGMGVLIVRTAARPCRVTSSHSCSVWGFLFFFSLAASNPTSHCCPKVRHTQV